MIQTMQKELRLVIKITVFSLIIFSSCNGIAQDEEEAYSFLKKVIKITKNNKDSLYSLRKGNLINQDLLNRYYNFRFNNKPFHTRTILDTTTNNIGIDSTKLRYDRVKWKEKWKVFDSIFNKEDIEYILSTKKSFIEWDSQKIASNLDDNKEKLQIKFCNP